MGITNITVTGDNLEESQKISTVISEHLEKEGFLNVSRIDPHNGGKLVNKVPSLMEHIRKEHPGFLEEPINIRAMQVWTEKETDATISVTFPNTAVSISSSY